MIKRIYLFLTASLVLICSGCIFPVSVYNDEMRAVNRAKKFAEQTLDIGSSPPDLIVFAPKVQVNSILRRSGADLAFTYRKNYDYNIRKVYQQEGIVRPEDAIFLCTDDSESWMNIIVVKEDDGKTSLWLRKPSFRSFEPEPGSPYHKDWLSIMRNECAMRGIRFTTPNTNSL